MLLLRKQAYWLINTKHYQPEIEATLKVLWTFRVHMLADLIDDKSLSSSQTLFSSQATATSGDESDTVDTRRAKLRVRERLPKLIETAVLCYFTLVLHRLPVLSSDIRSWLSSPAFPYVNAMTFLPVEMTSPLSPDFRRTLEASREPPHTLEHFHRTTMVLASAYQSTFSITNWPPLDTPPLLLKIITALLLPIDVFPGAQRLAELLDMTFDFSVANQKRVRISEHPEIQLMCTIIITTKLFYPFDDIKRYPSSVNQPSALKLDWNEWEQNFLASKAENQTPEQRKASNTVHLNTIEDDVPSMTGQQMDDYLDWFERTGWLNEDDAKQGREADYKKAVYAMFPREKTPQKNVVINTEDSKLEHLKAVQASLSPVPVVEEVEDESVDKKRVLRPGSKYERYRDVKKMPRLAKVFFEAAADLVSLSLDDMVRAVLQVEMKLGYEVDRKRKAEREEKSAKRQKLSHESGSAN